MSGVEAIFGVVTGAAGLISLGIQLGDSAFRLKRFYHATQDAPQAVASLAFSLETMAMAFRELEGRRTTGRTTGTLLDRCVADCQRNVCAIRQLVDKMEQLINSRRRTGRNYAAFKQQEIQDLLQDLERAEGYLEVGYMMYLADEQTARDRMLEDRLAQQ
jgi:hypothetical protein